MVGQILCDMFLFEFFDVNALFRIFLLTSIGEKRILNFLSSLFGVFVKIELSFFDIFREDTSGYIISFLSF